MVVFYNVLNSQWVINIKASDSITIKGINHIYNLEFELAEQEFLELIKRDPQEPAGYFFYAMIDWWRIMIDYENESLDEPFKMKLKKVIDICDERLEKNEFDLVALFFKCGSIGFRGRLFSHRNSWLKAADDGRLAYPILMQAKEIAPTNYDIMLGSGIYDYFAEVIPEMYPLLKPVMLFFPKGDRVKGIQELKLASEKARYANIESAYFLMQVYLSYENNPYAALEIAYRLVKKYPNNSVFYRYFGRCFVKIGNWIEVNKIYSTILELCAKKQRGYTNVEARESEFYLGLSRFYTDELDESLKHFSKCDELSKELDKNKDSGYMALANLRMGMIYDIQKKRRKALDQYIKVLKMKKYNDSHYLAEKFNKQPYKK
jgi:tetratricopeptide (TPR) repeat protein